MILLLDLTFVKGQFVPIAFVLAASAIFGYLLISSYTAYRDGKHMSEMKQPKSKLYVICYTFGLKAVMNNKKIQDNKKGE